MLFDIADHPGRAPGSPGQLGAGRRGPEPHGDRPRTGYRTGVGPMRVAAPGYGRHRAQRSFCGAGPGCDARMACRPRRGADQSAWVRHFARTSGRCYRWQDAGIAGPRAAPPRWPIRAVDHVHRRWSGACRGVRGRQVNRRGHQLHRRSAGRADQQRHSICLLAMPEASAARWLGLAV